VAKTKTINRILGKDFIVKASVGHIKDLPKRRLGVDIDDGFEPEYVTIKGKGKTLQELRKLATQSDQVFLATDPDREGEAIAYHIAEELKKKNPNIKRVLFNEITASAVRDAIEHPTEIDLDKVEAQKARRVMDRLVGYQISPILWKTIYRGLSAGRVQSVALRLICEREDEIEAFVPEEYWTITALLRGEETAPFKAKLVKIDGKYPKIPDEKTAKYYVEDIRKKPFKVVKIEKKDVRRNPPPPFTTSTLQQDAARRFGFTAQRIMSIAQQLYEGVELGSEGSVGLITYMRTDSTRVANEALAAVREYIGTAYGQEYLPAKPRIYRRKGNIQDAHEAIRPTSMQREPRKIAKYLTPDQLKLYQLIWNRFVASQMEAAVFEQTTIDISADEYLFRKTGSVVKFRGYLQVYQESAEKDENGGNGTGEEEFPVNLREGELLKLLDLLPEQHFTKPPARYSESTLIKELDRLGIGRPSTYAMIISTLLNRKYVEKRERRLHPTELGRTVNRLLVANFPDIFNVKFTAEMEAELDQIESGEKTSLSVLEEFYGPFRQAVERVNANRQEIKDSLQEKLEETCPECGSPLVIKWGRNGKFIACSNYPECRYTRPLEEEEVHTGEKCELCGAEMVVKVGRFGRFLACSNYPKCKNTKPLSLNIPCPKGCGGTIVERRTRRGKVFYGCSNYPKCDFATWYRPVAERCPQCGNPYMEVRVSKAKGEYLRCPNCKFELVPEKVEDE
ncbi:MAG TPA: type I DNA topoisomerase, partial [Bacteroidetes bacterium]|nr:type I DNA topoisomerase [Bacteroidota bacterium]